MSSRAQSRGDALATKRRRPRFFKLIRVVAGILGQTLR